MKNALRFPTIARDAPILDEDGAADVTVPWKREDAASVVPMMKPRAIAAIAAANPKHFACNLARAR